MPRCVFCRLTRGDRSSGRRQGRVTRDVTLGFGGSIRWRSCDHRGHRKMMHVATFSLVAWICTIGSCSRSEKTIDPQDTDKPTSGSAESAALAGGTHEAVQANGGSVPAPSERFRHPSLIKLIVAPDKFRGAEIYATRSRSLGNGRQGARRGSAERFWAPRSSGRAGRSGEEALSNGETLHAYLHHAAAPKHPRRSTRAT
jgi:hypothetical protein